MSLPRDKIVDKRIYGINNKDKAGKYEVYMLGVVITVASQFTNWNVGLSWGFVNFLIAVLVIGSGYVALVLCMAEMNCAVPFSGGNYGLARITLNKTCGYFVGCFETIQYLACVAVAAQHFGSIITDITGNSSDVEPLYWLAFYLFTSVLQVVPRKLMWQCVSLMSLLVVCMVLFYCGASPLHANFDRYSTTPSSFAEDSDSNAMKFFRCLPHAAWFFIGVDSLQVSSADILQPDKVMPKALYVSIVVVCCSAIGILFASVSLYPGVSVLAEAESPLSYGFAENFNVSVHSGAIYPLVALCCFGFGFTFVYARQITAMQRSRLIMTVMSEKVHQVHHLLAACISGGVLSFIVLLGIEYNDRKWFDYLQNVSLVAAFLSYLGVLLSYLSYKKNFSTLSQNYKSPLGVYGAMYGIVVFILAFVGIVALQTDGGMSFVLFLIFMSFFVIRYVLIGRAQQVFSVEEQSAFFIAYVVKANGERRRRQVARGAERNHKLQEQKSKRLIISSSISGSTSIKTDMKSHRVNNTDQQSSSDATLGAFASDKEKGAAIRDQLLLVESSSTSEEAAQLKELQKQQANMEKLSSVVSEELPAESKSEQGDGAEKAIVAGSSRNTLAASAGSDGVAEVDGEVTLNLSPKKQNQQPQQQVSQPSDGQTPSGSAKTKPPSATHPPSGLVMGFDKSDKHSKTNASNSQLARQVSRKPKSETSTTSATPIAQFTRYVRQVISGVGVESINGSIDENQPANRDGNRSKKQHRRKSANGTLVGNLKDLLRFDDTHDPTGSDAHSSDRHGSEDENDRHQYLTRVTKEDQLYIETLYESVMVKYLQWVEQDDRLNGQRFDASEMGV